MPVMFNRWQMLGLILTSALLWMHYVQLKDRHQPEPRRRLLIAFLLGAAACGLAALGYFLLELLGVPDPKFGECGWTAVFCFAFIGPLEEGAKVLMACLVVFRWREFDEPLDGFVYAAAIALGFASVENFYNTGEVIWSHQLARTVALPITHALFSAIWGFGIGYARFALPDPARRRRWELASIALSMFVHSLYDFLLLALQATLITSAMALVLWGLVIWRAKVLTKHRPIPAKPAPPRPEPDRPA